MKKNENKKVLEMSLNEEEKFINTKNIGIDKFSKADKILGHSFNNIITNNKKGIPGKRKTIYLSQNTLDIIKKLTSKLRSLDIGSNDSKIISAGLECLKKLTDEELQLIFNKTEY